MKRTATYLLPLLLLLLMAFGSNAQRKKKNQAEASPAPSFEESLYNGLEWRHIGPFRGGRSCAVTGVPGNPMLFYFGSTGGGVWRTKDGGNSYENISDGFFGGSIGAIAVSEYDNNVIYVGGGEKTLRGNMSSGYGIYKTVDAGKTWQQMGLPESRHISRLRIHPKNPDVVYAAVMGNAYKEHEQRGVFRSKDGGKTWEKVLFANNMAGAVDLAMDPLNPRILYATTWRVQRTPYSLESGGEGSSLWKSTDGGDSWKELKGKKGLPNGTWGINAVAVSAVQRDRVFAIIENEKGGVYRSDDGGENWQKVNDDRALRQRAWYYTRIYADTKDANTVYVMNVSYHKSTDGGKSFESANAPHGDHHDLWIAPEDPLRMIIGDDGGTQITYDGGENWTTYLNQPTAQFYRLATDNAFPYRIYAAQQDNSTIRIPHRTTDSSIDQSHWEETAGGESAHIAVSPKNNNLVYGGSYGGFLTEVNHDNNEVRAINVWPDNPMGYGAEGMKYRFQWNFPVFFSPHDPDKLYVASNHLHATTNRGQSWELLSPDLTTNDSTKLGSSGGPITKDNTGVEYYCTIFAACESPYEKDLLWTGSDDGFIHVSKDGGKNWENVTPKDAPKFMMWNSVEPDPFKKGAAYFAGTRYKMGDFQPYLYKTEDYGKSWKKITNGIAAEHFTRVVRADPKRQGLLYAGTETGMYISFDDGANWKPFQLNLPIVPITDLHLKENNLIAATQGRSLWLIDDLTPLHQLSAETGKSNFHLYKPKASYRMDGRQNKKVTGAGINHAAGVTAYFYLKNAPDSANAVTLKFLEKDGKEIIAYSTTAKEKELQLKDLKAGMNSFSWDMRYPKGEKLDGMVLWWASLTGPKAVPGTYKIRLIVGKDSTETETEILKTPTSSVSVADMQTQFDFLLNVRNKVNEGHTVIKEIRNAREQIDFVLEKVKADSTKKALTDLGKEIKEGMKAIEEALYQTKNRSNQDPLNFPIKLTNKLGHLMSLVGMGDFPPTMQDEAVRQELSAAVDQQILKWKQLKTEKLPAFNELFYSSKVEPVMLKE